LDFQRSSGYYDILIPNLKILSQSYCSYLKKLHEANEQFLHQFPEAQKLMQIQAQDSPQDSPQDPAVDKECDKQQDRPEI
jgi:hypothetical protein